MKVSCRTTLANERAVWWPGGQWGASAQGCCLLSVSQLGASRPGNGGDGTENQVNQVKILKSGAETVVMWSPRWGEPGDSDHCSDGETRGPGDGHGHTGDSHTGQESRGWRGDKCHGAITVRRVASGYSPGQGGSAYSVIVSIVSLSFIPHWPLTTSQRVCPHPLPGPWSGQRGLCVPSGAPWTPSTRRELRRVGWVSSDNCIILPFLLFEKKWNQYLICSVMWVAVRAKQFKVHNNLPYVITISIDSERVS